MARSSDAWGCEDSWTGRTTWRRSWTWACGPRGSLRSCRSRRCCPAWLSRTRHRQQQQQQAPTGRWSTRCPRRSAARPTLGDLACWSSLLLLLLYARPAFDTEGLWCRVLVLSCNFVPRSSSLSLFTCFFTTSLLLFLIIRRRNKSQVVRGTATLWGRCIAAFSSHEIVLPFVSFSCDAINHHEHVTKFEHVYLKR